MEDQGGAKWLEGPAAVFAKEMSYAEANARIGVDEGQFDIWPEETRVWLVIFEGRWELVPEDPSQANPAPLPYEGCLLVLFTASQGELMAMGDSRCPP